MLKKLLLVLAMMVATIGVAYAQVDVNKADVAALEGVKGIGPKTAQRIVTIRSKAGSFKDWADFEKRVKGIGAKRAERLSAAGLTVGGQPAPKAPPAKARHPRVKKSL